jgi:epoxyqueuosine reductase
MLQVSPDNALALTQAVKDEAHRLGFQLAGVTTPDPPPHLEAFERWLAEGRHAEMHYLAAEPARQRRANPRLILPECRSILVLGMRYAPSHSASPQPGKMLGRVASYAWGRDYHLVLPERLKNLVAFLNRQLGQEIPNRWYTDTGPVLERDLAQRAGLGWIGKNTCLIHPTQGSYFFLAEIFLGIELVSDPPFQVDHCGTCTRCLDACPTNCILPDRTIDARRCISYQTIELKGAIQPDLRQDVGEWVFGCDVCQQVCPWNKRFASPEVDPVFAPRAGMPWLDLGQVLTLTPQDFNRLFKDSPLKRAKRRGLLRNAVVALGNQADPASIPALAGTLLSDPEPLVRGHAAWALGQIGGEAPRRALRLAIEMETAPMVQEEIRRASR